MQPMAIPIESLQATALAEIATQLTPGRKVQVVAPEYVGPWQLAGLAVAAYLQDYPSARALFVYEPDRLRPRLAQYLGQDETRVVSPDELVQRDPATFDVLATTTAIYHRIASHTRRASVLHHGPGTEAAAPVGAVVLPTYTEVDGQQGRGTGGKLAWQPDDSVRYYWELFLANGGPVSGGRIVELAQAGQGPHKNRFFQDMDGMSGVRAAAHLGDETVYQRDLPLERRADILRVIGEQCGHTPTTMEVKAALAANPHWPSYNTFIKDTTFATLCEMAGQDPEAVGKVRQRQVGDWGLDDSVRLYRTLRDEVGRDLTLRELQHQLANYKGQRRPSLDELMQPFKELRTADDPSPIDLLRNLAVEADAPED